MKRARSRLKRAGPLLVVGLYILAGVAILKLLPVFQSQSRGQNAIQTPVAPMPPPGDATTTPASLKDFWGINFLDSSQPIRLQIRLPDRKTLSIRFRVGQPCDYEDHRACLHSYRRDNVTPVVVLTVHSGLGGEAEAFRQYVEGTGINRAGFALEDVNHTLDSLQGAQVTLEQGSRTTRGLELAALGRIPGQMLEEYFQASLPEVLAQAAAADPRLMAYAHPDQPVIVFETCGWRMRDEPAPPDGNNMTASIYLGVIRQRQ